MSASAPRSLTERQRAVMERIDRRVPIKVIAQDLGVSETRINQHIRALKNIYGAESLGELVERHRSFRERNEPVGQESPSADEQATAAARNDFSEPVYNNNQVFGWLGTEENGLGSDPGELVTSQLPQLAGQSRLAFDDEPRIVPRVLDGEHALWFRLAAIVGIAFGFLAAVVLTVTAAVTIGEALEGRATIPDDERGFS